jgi:hypothetical protein
MHQNKFHTETIQQLKDKMEASTKGGPPLDEYEKELADHLRTMYKFANKGIRGRGKKRDSEPELAETSTPEHDNQGRGFTDTEVQGFADEGRQFTEGLLPLPVSNPASFGASWSRSDRLLGEDVFVGNHGSVQSNYLGVSDGNSGIGGYPFGNMG